MPESAEWRHKSDLITKSEWFAGIGPGSDQSEPMNFSLEVAGKVCGEERQHWLGSAMILNKFCDRDG